MAKTNKIEDMTAEATNAAKEQMSKVFAGFEKMTEFGQENLSAVVEASTITAKAVETVSAENIAFSKKAIEDNNAVFKTLSAAKSPADFMEIQSQFAKTSFDAFIGQATKMTEIFTAASKDAFVPLNARAEATKSAAKSFTA